jgi:hypothetical protein
MDEQARLPGIDKNAPDAEGHAAIKTEAAAAKQVADEAEAARKARYDELLQDPLYQRLNGAAIAAKKNVENKRAGLFRHRITVGRDQGFCFSIVAEGDNWDEVVTKVAQKESAQ